MAEPRSPVIDKSTTLALGLAIPICAALWYVASTNGKILERLDAVPLMQQDIREVKRMLGANNGTDQRQDAELRAVRDRTDRHERRLDAVEKRK